MENLRVALVQMESLVGEKENNLEKISSFAKEAGKNTAHILCLPELAVSGYTRDHAFDLAEEIPGSSTTALLNMAVENKITILAGIIEKNGTGKPFITHLVCFPDGSYGKYRKTHLGVSELPYFSRGEELPIFKGKYGNFAVEICWDLHFPEVSTIYSLKGAEIIFAPHASPTMVGDRKEIWLKYLTARAYDNSVYLCSCNLVGINGKGSEFCGGLLAIDPKGQIIGEDFSREEKMLLVDLPGQEINKLRYQERKSMRNSFYLEYRRPELYGDLLKEIKSKK